MSIFTSVLKLPAEWFCSSLVVLSSILLIFFTFLNIADKHGLSPFDEDFLTFLSFKILTSFFFQKQEPDWLCSFRINRKKNSFFFLSTFLTCLCMVLESTYMQCCLWSIGICSSLCCQEFMPVPLTLIWKGQAVKYIDIM